MVGRIAVVTVFLVLASAAVTGAHDHNYPSTVAFGGPVTGSVTGSVNSTLSACAKRRAVKVFEVGESEPIGTDTTNGSGHWAIDATPAADVTAKVKRRSIEKGRRHNHICDGAAAGPVDRTPPVVDVTSPNEGEHTGPSGTIIYTVGDSDSVSCTLDGPAVACDTSGFFSYTNLSDGLHTFVVTGFDPEGNAGTSQVTWNVDGSPPVVSSLAIDGGSTSPSGSIRFQLTDSSEITEIHCVLDDATSVCGSGISGLMNYSDLEPGEHVIEVYAVDIFGNSGSNGSPGPPPAARARVAWTVD